MQVKNSNDARQRLALSRQALTQALEQPLWVSLIRCCMQHAVRHLERQTQEHVTQACTNAPLPQEANGHTLS